MRLSTPILSLSLSLIGVLSIGFLVLLATEEAKGESTTLYTLENRRAGDDIIVDINDLHMRELITTNLTLRSSIVASDIDGDGYPELFFASDYAELMEYSTRNDSYKVLFKGLEGAKFIDTPQMVDVDFDSVPECIIFDVGNDLMRCLDVGSEKVEWSIPCSFDMDSCRQPKIIRDEANGRCYVLLGRDYQTICLVDGQGSYVWNKTIPSTLGTPLFAVGDMNCDDRLEIIITTNNIQDGAPGLLIGFITCDLMTSKTLSSWNTTSEDMIDIPPLVYDLVANEMGLEVAICTVGDGIWVVSTSRSVVIWRRSVIAEGYKALDVVEGHNRKLLCSIKYDGIDFLNPETGDLIERQSLRTTEDIPIRGLFGLNDTDEDLLCSDNRLLLSMDPVTNSSTWGHWFPKDVRTVRYIFIRTGHSEVYALHIFAWSMEWKKLYHVVYSNERSDALTINVNPLSFIAYPNRWTTISGISITGIAGPLRAMTLRLLGGTACTTIIITQGGILSTNYSRPVVIRDLEVTEASDGKREVALDLLIVWQRGLPESLDLEVTCALDDGTMQSREVPGYLRIEERLVLAGRPTARDGEGREYHHGDWAPANTSMVLSGLSLLFLESSVAPQPSDIELLLSSDGSEAKEMILSPIGEIAIEFTTPDWTSGTMASLIDISARHTSQMFHIAFNLSIDGTAPRFLGFFPDNGTWIGDTAVLLGCLATDGDGSGIGELMLQLGPSEASLGNWLAADSIVLYNTDAEGLKAMVLGEGTFFLRWRADDLVGIGPVTSGFMLIHIDVSDVRFDDFAPVGWTNDTDVVVSITVSDQNGSGVDLGSISYAVSLDGLFSFSDWASAGLSGERSEIRVVLHLRLGEGVDNLIVLRASDMVGNERDSNVYQVLVDATAPVLSDPMPLDGAKIDNATTVHCSIRVTDALSGVDVTKTFYRFGGTSDELSEWTMTPQGDHEAGRYHASVDNPGTSSLVIMWKVTDLAGNEAVSAPFTYSFNQPPKVIKLLPRTPHTAIELEMVDFLAVLDDPENDTLAVCWSLDAEAVSNETWFNRSFLQGRYMVVLTVDDNHGNENSYQIEIIVTETSNPSVRPQTLLYLVIALLTVITISVYAHHRMAHERKRSIPPKGNEGAQS